MYQKSCTRLATSGGGDQEPSFTSNIPFNCAGNRVGLGIVQTPFPGAHFQVLNTSATACDFLSTSPINSGSGIHDGSSYSSSVTQGRRADFLWVNSTIGWMAGFIN